MKKEVSKNQISYNVTFNVSKSNAEGINTISVLGDFNEWSYENAFELKKNKKGDFEGKFEIPAGRDYHFRYLINGNIWANEANADRQEVSPLFNDILNSVLSLPILKSIDSAKKDKSSSTTQAIKPVVKVATSTTENSKKIEIKSANSTKSAVKKSSPSKTSNENKKVEVKSTPSKDSNTQVKTTNPKATTSAKKVLIKEDDLKLIEGIGPKIAELLKAASINTFEKLANTKKEVLAAILEAAGSKFKMHDPSSWAQQSKLAANGKMEELKKLQSELLGGKKVK